MALDIWSSASEPILEDALCAKLHASHSNGLLTAVVHDLTKRGVLMTAEFSSSGHDSRRPQSKTLPCEHLLVCITGSIQASAFQGYLLALRSYFCQELKIVLTQSAKRFVSEEALAWQLDVDITSEVFPPTRSGRIVPHVHLSQWATCILVAPASAAAIYRIANATCDDLTSLIVAAANRQTPVVLGPSMNSNMWENPAVQRNIATCRSNGYWIIEPGNGDEISRQWDSRQRRPGGLGVRPDALVCALAAIYQLRQ